MIKTSKVFMVLGVLVLELLLTLAAELNFIRGETGLIGNIVFQLFLALLGVRVCLRQKQFFCSPFFLVLFMAVFFSVAGEIIFIAREYLGIGWGGRPDEVSVFFRRFCLISFVFFFYGVRSEGFKYIVIFFW